MKRFFSVVMDAIADVQMRRSRRHLLEQLDEYTLRDIGMEHEANRARARTRQLFMHFGMY